MSTTTVGGRWGLRYSTSPGSHEGGGGFAKGRHRPTPFAHDFFSSTPTKWQLVLASPISLPSGPDYTLTSKF